MTLSDELRNEPPEKLLVECVSKTFRTRSGTSWRWKTLV